MIYQNTSPFTEEATVESQPRFMSGWLRMRQRPKGGWLRMTLVYGAAVMLFLYYGRFRITPSYYDDAGNLDRIILIEPLVTGAIGFCTLAAAVTLIVAALISFWRGWLRWPVLGLAIGIFLFPYCAMGHSVSNWYFHWRLFGQVEAASGRTYVYCDQIIGEGQTMALTERESVNPIATTYQVLVATDGDLRSWASVIRSDKAPDTSPDKYSPDEFGQLYLCKELLVGVRDDNRCYMAYDLKNKKGYGHNEIESLSPFACLMPGDTPKEADIVSTCGRISKHATFCVKDNDLRHAQAFLRGEPAPGCPSLASIRAGLASDSPGIVVAAKRLLASYEEGQASVRARFEASTGNKPEAEQPSDKALSE